MMKDQSSIQSKFLNKMLIIVFVFVGLWSLIWIYGEYADFKIESESLRSEHVDSQKSLLKKEVNRVVSYINEMNSHADQTLEISLKERVYQAHQIAINIYQQNVNSKDLPEIKKMIKDALRPIRFNQNRGYYFAVSMDGVNQLYPAKPEFEGSNVLNLKDSKGDFVIQDEIKVIEQQGEGFVKHFWKKPEKESNRTYPKLSFVKYFKPLDWYLGTGEYLDESKKQLQIEVLQHLINLRFETEGYFFGSTYQGDSLFSNGKITVGSGNVWDLTDQNGVRIIQEQKKAVENPEGGFVYYSWNKLETATLSPKVSFVKGVSEWEWTIGAGVYLDTIEDTISKNKEGLIIGFKKKIGRSFLILICLLSLIYFWSKRIANQLQETVHTFSSFLTKASIESIVINPDDIQLTEFKEIAISTNKMLEDRRKAEKKLRRSEKKHRKILEGLNDAAYRMSLPDGKYEYFSKAAKNVFGYDSEKWLNNPQLIREIIHPDFIDYFKQNWAELIDGKVPESYEYKIIDNQGNERWIFQTNTGIFNDQGKIIALEGLCRNVTSHKQAEEALKESEFLFSQMFEQSTTSMCLYNPQGTILKANQEFCKMFGVQEKTIISAGYNMFKDQAVIDTGIIPLLRNIFDEKKSQNWQIDYDIDLASESTVTATSKTGKMFLEAFGYPVLNHKGNLEYVVLQHYDITKRKQAKEALKASENEYKSTLDNLLIGVIVHAGDTSIILSNPEATNILGLTYDQMLGKKSNDPAWSFMHEDLTIMKVKDYPVSKVFLTKKPLYNYILGINRPDRNYITWVLVNAIPVFSTSNELEKVIVNFIDISDSKQAELEKENLESQLRQAAKIEAVGTLAGGIAHDFNNILGIIIGNTELAIDDVPDWNPARQNLNEIKTASLRARDVVRQLLSFSRKTEQKKRPSRIDNIIKESVQLLRASIPSSVELRSNIVNDLQPIMADPTQIHQVVINLCTNAAHAMEENGGILEVNLTQIEIDEPSSYKFSQASPGLYIQLTVSDTGHGIDPMVEDRIFDPYFTTKETDKGTGIGLSVVHGIVKNHDGAIIVDSQLNIGTTIKVMFPVIEEKYIEEKKASGELLMGNENVLFVDDEKALLKIGKQILERLGYRVQTNTNPVEALEQFRSNPNMFDLVITDMTMPQMTGDKFAREILKIQPDIPIILCTGYSDKMSRESAKKIGIRKYIEKPLNTNELSTAIRKILDKK